MFLRKSLFGISGLVLACGIVAFAQEPRDGLDGVGRDGARDEIEQIDGHGEPPFRVATARLSHPPVNARLNPRHPHDRRS